MKRQRVGVIFAGLPARMTIKLSRAGINKHVVTVAYCQSLEHACNVAIRWQPKH